MHSIELELHKACDFKPRKKYNDRQEYLRAILVAANKLSDDDFDNLSDDAAGWVDACIKVHNAHKNEDLPDFDEVGDAEDSEADDSEPEADADEGDAEESDEDESEGEDEPEDMDDETDPSEDDEEGDPEEDEPAPVKPIKKAKAAAPKKPVKLPELKNVSAAAKKKLKNLPEEEGDVVLDKWGCMEGSKNSLALNMFERGATAKEVKVELGGTYYNILSKMVQRGHKLEKEGHLIKLTHKDEFGAKPKKSKK